MPFQYTGIRNVGNSCFMNALVQSYLRYHAELTKIILEYDLSLQRKYPERKDVQVMCELKKLFELLLCTKDIISPDAFLNAFSFDFSQQDISEYNFKLLEMIEKALELTNSNAAKTFHSLVYGTKFEIKNNILLNKKPKLKTFPIGPGDFNIPMNQAYNILDAFETSRKNNEKEYTIYYKVPPCLWINLNRFEYTTEGTTKINSHFSIQETIDLVSIYADSSENLENICNRKGIDGELNLGANIQKSFFDSVSFLNSRMNHKDIPSFSKIPDAIQVLKEYHDLSFNTMNRLKEQKVQLEQSIGFNQIIYHLHSILCHKGNASRGHYIAYIKEDNIWWKCNDSVSQELSFQDVIKECSGGPNSDGTAYCLMYVVESGTNFNIIDENLKNIKQETNVLSEILQYEYTKLAEQIVNELKMKWRSIKPSYYQSYFTPFNVLEKNFLKIYQMDESIAQLYLLSACLQEQCTQFPSLISKDRERILISQNNLLEYNFLIKTISTLVETLFPELVKLLPPSNETIQLIHDIIQ